MSSIFHITVHKCASTWFRDFFRDELMLKALPGARCHYEMDLKHRIYEDYCKQTMVTLPDNAVITNIYCDRTSFDAMPKPDEFRAFYMMRDPRELIVSSYWSWRVNHPGGHGNRKLLNDMLEEDGLLWTVRELDERLGVFRAMRSWVDPELHKQIAYVKFEDFFDARYYVFAVMGLLDYLGATGLHKEIIHDGSDIFPGSPQFADLLKRFSFPILSGGRLPGQEDKTSHYRRGQTGSWREMPDSVLKDFYKRTDNLVELLRYENE